MDIRPQNVMVELDPVRVHLLDFGTAVRLHRESQPLTVPPLLEATLSYMSPEQTGHTNRVIDARSDLYSLGITLYEMLSGVLPFTSAGPLELSHCHIARIPRRLDEVDAAIPKVVADVVAKLLSKPAENRYQSGDGLVVDLRRCLQELEANGRTGDFPIGERDRQTELLLPRKLYGRAAEADALLSAFQRAADGAAELLLVKGSAGVGKSALLQESQEAIARRGGCIAFARFDPLKRTIPYGPIAQALSALLHKRGSEEIKRQQLQEALGTSARVLAELIPELELILGPQPAAGLLSPAEEQRRFELAVTDFLRIFAKKEQPLVLFFDDLQWADAASLKLLQHVLTRSERGHLLIIGAYRDREVWDGHPLTLALHELRRLDEGFTEVAVGPLPLEQVAALLADVLRCDLPSVQPLAQLVFKRTHGTPLLVHQFLHALKAEGLLFLSLTNQPGRWQWDAAAIEACPFRDGLLASSAERLEGLPEQGLPVAASVLRLAQSFSSELVFDKVLEQVMRAMLITSGAERALLLLLEETFRMAAILETGQEKVLLANGEPLESTMLLPITVAHQVGRTHLPVVLGSASRDARFAGDPYILAKRPKSVLCLPLIHQGGTIGIVYLENNLLAESFGAYVVELLQILASQAAAAVENARRYLVVQKVSQKLQQANEALEQQLVQQTVALRTKNDELRLAEEALLHTRAELHTVDQRLHHELTQREQAELARGALQDEIVRAQKARLAELVTPLIPITDEIMVMPLIGTMDRERAQQVLEAALEGAQKSRAQVVILDITGITHMDASVAGRLVNTATALRLLGAEAVLTGIRSDMAQLLIMLGISMTGIVTKSTLQSGIAYAMQKTESSLLRRQGDRGKPGRLPSRS